MDIEQYSKQALRTTESGLSPTDQIINAVMGLSGESGEIIDYIKKALFHNKPCDPVVLVKELGDCLFYMNWLAWLYGIDWSEIMTTNLAKLQARYPNGFNFIAANNRDLTAEEAAINASRQGE